MFNALYFTYDGINSGKYGLIIADFDDSTTTETEALTPTLSTFKPVTVPRFMFDRITYDTQPTYQFSMLRDYPISQSERREILTWLTGRNKYLPLIVHQPDLLGITYRCIFTDVSTVWVHGQCYGFRVTANFESPYAKIDHAPRSVISGTGDGQSYATYTIYNDSDIIDDYVYPIITFTPNGTFTPSSVVNPTGFPNNTCVLSVFNTSFENSIKLQFYGLTTGTEYTVDNELKIIKGSGSNKVAGFNRNWMKLKKGENSLNVRINGSFRIECPTYVKIGY